MKTYKHSGAAGDLLYSLALVKYWGGGDFYLHLNQMNWIGKNYYGTLPVPFHQDRLNEADYEYMKDFMLAQTYINDFKILNPKTDEISVNLDRFRAPFASNPGNYIDCYANTFSITDPVEQSRLRNTAWLSVPGPIKTEGRNIVINRTQRWIPPEPSPQWALWAEQGLPRQAVFVGLESEYVAFQQQIGWDIPWRTCTSQLELAQVIAGADMFIGNQSQALALAIGLGQRWCCEIRRDLPKERNECYFDQHPMGNYF